MIAALSTDQRGRLDQLVMDARKLLEDDLADQAAGRFGIDADGTVANEEDLHLDPFSLATRRELVGVVDHLRSEGETRPGAAARLLREAVFTHLNRLIAIRIAEALELLPASLADGRRSQGFRDVLELAPLLAGDDTGGYWMYLQLCGDELAGDMPALFDPRNPLLGLAPTPAAIDELVTALANPADADLWLAPDTLGWTYQYFNRKEERDAMREASSSPRTSRELAVRNQFFTPRYVVDFLVQNTLGRRLIESDPASPLADELTLLVDPAQKPGSPLELDEVAVLDPAVGSGHFLLGAFDLLERAWELAGVPPAEAAPQIVRSLWGIDIDARAAQVAAAAVMLRARRHCRDLPLPRPNIITARALPVPAGELLTNLKLSASQQRILGAISAAMARAPELGPLLKVETELEAEIRHGGLGSPGHGTLEVTDEAFAKEESELLGVLRRLADEATSSAAERLFVAEADDALRFVEAMRQRYDAVLMNPPFGEPIPETKPYLRAAYSWAPSRVDILACFVGRGLELCKPGGYLGAITNRAGLFITTFKEWRQQVLLSNRLITLADLGYRVMTQAKVEAAAYVIGEGSPEPNLEGTFIRLLKDPDKATALTDAIGRLRDGEKDHRVYRLRLTDLDQIPGVPIAYSMSSAIRRLFSDLPAIGDNAAVRQGLVSGDDARFVRAFWEVDPRRIARSAAETHVRRRWAPFAKGGEYGQYWSDIHLVVEYEREGERLLEAAVGRVQNTQHYFLPGLTWPRRTNSAMSVRVLPGGCIFADKGPAVISQSALPLLGWLNSRYVRLLIDTTSAGADEDKTDVSRSYEVGTIKTLPDPTGLDHATSASLARLALAAAEARAIVDEFDETTRRFVSPAIVQSEGASLRDRACTATRSALERAIVITEAHDDIDRALRAVLDPDGSAEEALYDADGPLVTDLPRGTADASMLTRPATEVIAAAISQCGIARWIGLQHHVADRRLQLAAVAQGLSPRALVDAAVGDLLPIEEPKRSAEDLVSYLMGAALGRWDVRIGRDPGSAPARPDVFAAIPLCPPGMLVGEDGFPSRSTRPGYPVKLPPAGYLVDQAGHTWDLETALNQVAQALFDDAVSILQELSAILGRSLRDHLRRQFFRDHIVRYSKSKRKAPIYWPLYVPSGYWGVWVYAPVLSREMLYGVARAAADRLDGAEAEIRRLHRERDAGGAGRSTREVVTALTAEEQLAEELRRYRAEAERIAGLGWEPDLDDGMMLCAAPLANLFPSWRDAATARAELNAGKHSWATVSRWAGQL